MSVATRSSVAVGLVLGASSVLRGDGDCLRTCALAPLPLGSIQAEGHLREKLVVQASGLTGRAESVYPDIGQSDWLTQAGAGGQFAWERGPYYARGLVALALTLGDESLKTRAAKWVDAILASQRKDGDFGPRSDNWWANMLSLTLLRDWADATGDVRVQPFLERYFAYQEGRLADLTLEKESGWACARGGDELEVVYWLYGRTGNARWLDLASRLIAQTADWTSYYRFGGDPRKDGYRCHIVNFMQGLKFPALKWRMSGDEADRTGYAAAFDPSGWAWRQCGRPDSMLNGSEPLTDRSASAGTELCAIAERVISCGTVLSVTGEATVADDLEDVVYNALSATVLPDGKGVRYYLMLNQPMCVDKGLMFANNGSGGEITGANCPGPHSGFGCCRSNWHVAWPRFVQTMWMRKDGGLAAVAHGPSVVSAQLPSGKMTVREETDYPFSGKVVFRIVEGCGRFPLFVRIPGWTGLADAGTFRRYARDWKVGDFVEVEFPMQVEVSAWGRQALAVRRGPLLYTLKIGEERKRIAKYKVPHEKRWIDSSCDDLPRWEIRPTTAWNYALSVRNGRLADVEVVDHGAALRVRAARTEFAGWGCMRADAPGRAIDPPESPVDRVRCGSEETITLVPIGTTQLHLTLFPWFENVAQEKGK